MIGTKDILNFLLTPNLLQFVEMEVIAKEIQVSYHITVPLHHKSLYILVYTFQSFIMSNNFWKLYCKSEIIWSSFIPVVNSNKEGILYKIESISTNSNV